MLTTRERGEVRREQRAMQEQAAMEAAHVVDDAQRRTERAAARHYVAQRRALTGSRTPPPHPRHACLTSRASIVPESPALRTKMRGEIHAAHFDALVAEEEAAFAAASEAWARDVTRFSLLAAETRSISCYRIVVGGRRRAPRPRATKQQQQQQQQHGGARTAAADRARIAVPAHQGARLGLRRDATRTARGATSVRARHARHIRAPASRSSYVIIACRAVYLLFLHI
jgi:hypothetical protein